ncbi:MAG: dTMP kinase [Planctomycetota bacterium]
MKKKYCGKFIVIDGPDGGGKTTQTGLLADHLSSKHIPFIKIREPGSTRIGEKIRKILLNPLFKDISLMTELFLYMACRAQLVEEIIKPALKSGRIVLCERFLSSSIAYQGKAGGLGEKTVRQIGLVATDRIKPDLTIILDISTAHGLTRIRHRKKNSLDRIEARRLEFHKKVRAGFRKLAGQDPAKVKLIDASEPVALVQARIRKLIDYVI